ncbi:fumarylacetoacetate hydrolase family protein [Thozetella sp. PMI_491]|nr:fumarylacetoacetate hydrolase family protein [Thozetella sp. PMI_491]
MAFQKLVRYEEGGEACYGDLVNSDERGHLIKKLRGNLEDGFTATSETFTAQAVEPKLLCPVERTPIIMCVGLNYRKHAEEAKLTVPKYPVIFAKPADALAGPTQDVIVHPVAQERLDYEGELCVVMGRDAKNISASEALDYVLGYTIGNDISARNFQAPGVSGGQFTYAKAFDTFAPIGPAIYSRELVPDPQKLKYRTIVNGELRQETETSDMIWTVQQIIEHLTKGTTLRRGTVIMTGTPSGVGAIQGKYLKDGHVVVVELDSLGMISNKIVFEK